MTIFAAVPPEAVADDNRSPGAGDRGACADGAFRPITEPLRPTTVASIRQHFHRVLDEPARLESLCRLLLTYCPESGVVFCNTKRETQEVADTLGELQCPGPACDLEQRDRDRTLVMFANKSVSILVATDMAALQKLGAGKLKGRSFRARRVI